MESRMNAGGQLTFSNEIPPMCQDAIHKLLQMTAFLLLTLGGANCSKDTKQTAHDNENRTTDNSGTPVDRASRLFDAPAPFPFLQGQINNLEDAWMVIPEDWIRHPLWPGSISPETRKQLWQDGKADLPEGTLSIVLRDAISGYLRVTWQEGNTQLFTEIRMLPLIDLAAASREAPEPIAEQRIGIAHQYDSEAFVATIAFHMLAPYQGQWRDRKHPIFPEISLREFGLPQAAGEIKPSLDLFCYAKTHQCGLFKSPDDFLRWQLPMNGTNVLVAPGKIRDLRGLPQDLLPLAKLDGARSLYENTGIYFGKGSQLGDALFRFPLAYFDLDIEGKPVAAIPKSLDSRLLRAGLISRNRSLQGILELEGRPRGPERLEKMTLAVFRGAQSDMVFITGHAQKDQALVFRCISKTGRDYEDLTAARFPFPSPPQIRERLSEMSLDPELSHRWHLELRPQPSTDPTQPYSGRVLLHLREPSSDPLFAFAWYGDRFQIEPKPAGDR